MLDGAYTLPSELTRLKIRRFIEQMKAREPKIHCARCGMEVEEEDLVAHARRHKIPRVTQRKKSK